MFGKTEKQPSPPCRYCQNHLQTADYNCHSVCKAYLEYHAAREKLRQQRLYNGVLNDHKAKTMHRFQHQPLKDQTRL